MTETVYLIRMCLCSLQFLLIGLVIGSFMALPDGRRFFGLADNAAKRAFEVEVAFAQECPGEEEFTRPWVARLEVDGAPIEPVVKSKDIVGRMSTVLANIQAKWLQSARPWLVLVGMRGVAVLSLLLSALPLLLAVWLLGRRRSFSLFRRGEPASDAQRKTWLWAAGMAVLTLGVLISAPVAVPMIPWLVPTILLLIALLYPIRASMTARI